MINFMTHSINTSSKKKTMSDLVDEYVNKKNAKLAQNEESLVKTASKTEDKVEAKVEEKKEVKAEAKVEAKVEAKAEEKKEEKKEEKAEEKKEATVSGKFFRVAKLNNENKAFLRAEFEKIYPKEYVDLLIKD